MFAQKMPNLRVVSSLLMVALLASACQTIKPIGVSVVKPGLGSAKPVVPSSNAGISGGGLVGGSFGAALNDADKSVALNAEYRALEYAGGGELVSWTGKDGKSAGKVVAAQPYRVGSQDCRQYKHELTIGATVTNARATACRNNDGSWTLLN
ncbi:MAG: hypothetical protein WCC66_09780 [Rhizobiaceae bacterium]